MAAGRTLLGEEFFKRGFYGDQSNPYTWTTVTVTENGQSVKYDAITTKINVIGQVILAKADDTWPAQSGDLIIRKVLAGDYDDACNVDSNTHCLLRW